MIHSDHDRSPVLAALEEADRRERTSRRVLYAAAAMEVVLLAAALLVMDFGNPTHVLVLILAVLTYSTLALGMVAMATRASAENARLLHAIQLLDERRGDG
jgi:hypothetical protein